MREKTIMFWVDEKLKNETIELARINKLSVSDYIRRMLIQEITKAKVKGDMRND